MIPRDVKQEIAETMAKALEAADWEIQPVDYRTFNIRVRREWGGIDYLSVQVRELL